MKKIMVLLVMWLPISVFAWKMESGTVQLNDTYADSAWVTVSLRQTYTVPPLIFALPTNDGGDPLALRIKNVTTDSFDILQVEPSGKDGPHVGMTIHYIAVDPGEHYFPDGTRIVAGKLSTTAQQAYKNVDVTTGWDDIAFGRAFENPPVVLGMIQTLNNEVGNIPTEPSVPFLTTVLRNVDETGFQIALERSEVEPGDVNNSESIAYLAIDNNVSGTLPALNEDVLYEVASKDDVKGWSNGCYTYTFVNSYSSAPNVVSTKQTREGNNGGWLRRCALDENETGLTVDEDTYYDDERSHIAETAGILVFEKDFAFDSSALAPVAEYRMDECYWLSDPVKSVKDSSSNGLDGAAYNDAAIDTINARIGFSGIFDADSGDYVEVDDTPLLDINGTFTVTAWVYPTQETESTTYVDKSDSDRNGWRLNYFYSLNRGTQRVSFLVSDGNGNFDGARLDIPSNWINSWHLLVGVYDGDNVKLYIKDVDVDLNDSATSNGTPVAATNPMHIGSRYDNTRNMIGNIDEVKIWNYAFSDSDVLQLYENEIAEKNYDASYRRATECRAAISGGTWDLIGIPADLRTETDTSIAKILGDDMNGTYGDDWRIYAREYSDTNNSSWYTYLSDINTPLEFGKAYWLGSKNDEAWDVNDMQAVDYNSTNSACTTGTCVEVDVKSVSLDEDIEDTNGTGPYRYYMTGFVGKTPVDWADCRFIIDGTVYTPSDAEAAGYVNKQIWQYNVGSTDPANQYNTCDDSTPGSCLLEPYKGFWIELHGPTKEKTVKLLIPKE